MRIRLCASAFVLVLSAVCLLTPSGVAAAWQVNGTPVCTASGEQFSPGASSDGAHGAVVSWVDGPDYEWRIFCQRVDSAGGVVWGAGGIEVLSLGEWDFYHANSDYRGGLLCGFGCAGGTPSNPDARDVCIKHVTSAGALEAWPAACTDTSDQYYPWICPTSFGYYADAYATWYDTRNGELRAYLQGWASGSTLWPDGLLVGGYPGADLQNLMAFASEDDGAVVAWGDTRNGDRDIFAQCVLPWSGSLLWGEYGTPVFEGAGTQTLSRLVTDGNYGALALWSDASKYLFGQRLNGYGSKMWGESGDTISSSGSAARGLLIFDGKDGGIFSWREGAGPYTLRVQRLDAAGTLLWGTEGVVVESGSAEQVQQIVTDGARGVIVAWVELTGGNYVIRAQRVDSLGTVVWTPGGVTVRSLPSYASSPSIASDGNHGAIIVWEDDRSDAGDIYAARIAADGTTVAVGSSPAAVPLITRIEGNAPNPFNPVTKVEFALRDAGPARLCVYDISGRLVRVLKEGLFDAGRHEVLWDGTDSDGDQVASGVYVCRLEGSQIPGRVDSQKMVVIR